MNLLKSLKQELQSLQNPVKAKTFSWFFKTGKGEYGEGDKFLGITVPLQRIVAKKYAALSLPEIAQMLKSPVHEHRFTVLEILVFQFETGTPAQQKKIFEFYIKNSQFINNWDLVDTSAPYIVGEFLLSRPRAVLYKLVKSKNVWQRRIAIVSTYAFIRQNQFSDTLKISQALLTDTHSLIHKAVGWMLREVGKRDNQVLKKFLSAHLKQLPRTTLRYAIERFPEKERKRYLAA